MFALTANGTTSDNMTQGAANVAQKFYAEDGLNTFVIYIG